MNKIIHIQTQVSCIFGEVDEAGDVVKQIPLQIQISKLTPEAYAEAAVKLQEEREKLILENQQIPVV